jgi:CHAT domain-containing protein
LRFDTSRQAALALIVGATPRDSLALIVGAHGVVPVWLGLTAAELRGLLVESGGGMVTGGYLPGQLGILPLRPELDRVLKVLAAKVVGPVVEVLSRIAPEQQGRPLHVVLIPTGQLALLPLHAATYLSNGRERTLLDDAVVSYAPGVIALAHCHRAVAALPSEEATLVAVGNPLPLPSPMPPLAFARPEVEEISLLFGGRATVWYEEQATLEVVEKHLNRGSHLHLSCHGLFAADAPLASAVILSGGERLTLKDLIDRHRLTRVRLAVLSACQTAVTDFIDLPEEVLGLAAGFLQAGVPGVVGALWPVNDLSTALLMIQFYRYHLVEHLGPPEALRKAQAWLRDVTNAELTDLFDGYRKAAADRPESRMAYPLAQDRYRKYVLGKPDGRPFVHPYYWAPFVFYGA